MKTKRVSVFTVLNYVFFVLLSIAMLYPFWYVLMFALSDPDAISFNDYFLLPSGKPTLSTLISMVNQPMIYIALKNTVFVTVIGTLLALLLTSITAYPLSVPSLMGKDVIFSIMLFTMIFSGGMIPTYLVVRSLGLVDSLWALIILPSISVFNVMIFVKFFKGIPQSLIESAKIDGYNDIYIFWKIVLPLSRAVLAAIGLFCAVGLWNTYVAGVIYINSNKKRVLQVVLQSILQGNKGDLKVQKGEMASPLTPENIQMSIIVITLVPILLVYPFLQKHFVKGVMLGSIKE